MSSNIMTEIISALTGSLTSFATNFGAGLQSFVTSLFLTGTGDSQTLSVFGELAIIFAGIGLAIGVCSLIFHWITSLGARN